MKSLIIFWFRNDLRLSDNPGFSRAVAEGMVMPIFILEEEIKSSFNMGSASRWWLHHSLKSLDQSLQHKLHFYRGKSLEVFKKLLKRHEIKAVYWSRSYESLALQQEQAVEQLLQQREIPFQSFNTSLLWEPSQILKKDQKSYQVFTPFYREALAQSDFIRMPLSAPRAMKLFRDRTHQDDLNSLALLPKIPWHDKLTPHWKI